ncbi:serine/threonine protein kinase [Aspergillus sclerotioniger CBS 115572]|uniref:Serine/threonine protein kinase n=1 Tax=Aspergillus sclerotioniger CBS 115572 TaxID=1450535 RepID=A0A317WYI6_9EURO|nr:serine/threonine protein kinase [Aspergillus sclerotioniger CBS 115572]PWY91433.1 serine/threonine protein kinase [Aspergillus sclerotioniger CBS 115572]
MSQAQLPYFVGTLSEWNPETQQESNPLAIFHHQKIYVGRDPKKCQYVVNHIDVSRRHLHIYTVMFDEENLGQIPPLVYAKDISQNGTFWNTYSMADKGGFLLGHGDILELASGYFLRFTDPEQTQENVDPVRAQEMKILGSTYCITPRKLGSGAYGQVYMAYKKIDGQQLACKVIDLRPIRDQIVKEPWTIDDDDEEDPAVVRRSKIKELNLGKKAHCDNHQERLDKRLGGVNREATLLKDLCHPNIISVEKMIRTSFNVYLFQELVPGGDLFSYIQYKGGKLGNIDAAVIVRQILLALDYLHDRNIVHRDLKPDNILMTSLADGCRVVLSDFGCATHNPGRMSRVVGTFEYMAPEIHSASCGGYTEAVDIWSLGCVTAVLLTGSTSCGGSLEATGYVTELAEIGGFDKLETSLRRNNASYRAIDFIRRLLNFTPSERLTAKQGLDHEWFTNPAHLAEFESLYQRSIRDWSPCRPLEPFIVEITSLESFKDRKKEREAASIDSHLEKDSTASYRSSPEQMESSVETLRTWSTEKESSSTSSSSSSWEVNIHDVASPTLSDPNFPPSPSWHMVGESFSPSPENREEIIAWYQACSAHEVVDT